MVATVGMTAALVVSASGSSAAAPFQPVGGSGSQEASVVLAGRSAVYPFHASRYDTPVELRLGQPGRPARLLLKAPLTSGRGVEQAANVAASPRFAVVGLTDFRRTEESVAVPGSSAWAGGLQAPLAPLALPGARPWVTAVAADGDRVAVLVDDRAEARTRTTRLVVINLRSGARLVRRMPANTGLELDLAGRYLAFQRDLSTASTLRTDQDRGP